MAGTQLSTQQQTQLAQRERTMKLSTFLDERAEDFKKVATVDTEKFLRVVKNAILRDPLVAEASAQSVYLECMKAMNDGLVLDGREAALTRFRTNKRYKEGNQWHDNWTMEVVYIPMVAGIMKRVRASGEIKAWTVELVYEEEFKAGKFRYIASPDPVIHHEPIIVGERGPVVAAYSAVRLADGSHHYEVMTLAQLTAIKNRTKSKRTKKIGNQDVEEITGPWATDEEEMFRKTVIRRHAKRLPVSSATSEVASRVDALYDLDGYNDDEEVVPTAPAPKRSNAAGRLRKATAAQPKPQQQPEEPADEQEDDDAGEDGGEALPLDGDILDAHGEPIHAGRTFSPEDEF